MSNASTKRVSRQPVMRNKILAVTQGSIPYVKELRRLKLVKSTNACLLMQQLDYWFERKPQGFYKFLSPCEAIGYKQGDSWCEELGFSEDEFRNAFDQIGVRYKSKKEFNKADNKFLARNKATGKVEEKYYCSYFDKIRRQTFYFRNQAVVDSALDSISSTEAGEAEPYEAGETGSRNWQGQAIESGEGKPDYTETTTQTTSDITQEREGLAYASSHSKNIYEGNSDSSLESSFTHTEPAGGEIIDAEPVFDDQPRAATGGVASALPTGFRVTEEMRTWAAENTPAIDVDRATRKFLVHYEGQSRKDWMKAWQMWILRERPDSSYARRLTWSEQHEEEQRLLAEGKLFDDVEEDEPYHVTAKRLFAGKPKIANPRTASQRRTNELIDAYNTDLFADVTD